MKYPAMAFLISKVVVLKIISQPLKTHGTQTVLYCSNCDITTTYSSSAAWKLIPHPLKIWSC